MVAATMPSERRQMMTAPVLLATMRFPACVMVIDAALWPSGIDSSPSGTQEDFELLPDPSCSTNTAAKLGELSKTMPAYICQGASPLLGTRSQVTAAVFSRSPSIGNLPCSGRHRHKPCEGPRPGHVISSPDRVVSTNPKSSTAHDTPKRGAKLVSPRRVKLSERPSPPPPPAVSSGMRLIRPTPRLVRAATTPFRPSWPQARSCGSKKMGHSISTDLDTVHGVSRTDASTG
mmetsp:Transcript_25543/g.66818  ORF Transcript_25543/g.66818 Transcript_25543/m.66818 type:complete len:232 (+) Transcript_25543:143-838(+)